MPGRHDDPYPEIASFASLEKAAQRAISGKRKKPGATAFFARLETELFRLERELMEGSYRPGRYLELVVRDPKRRVVSVAPFRDRVVHHALVSVIQPIFERGFIDDSFANRKGKGTHRAVGRYEYFRDRHAHVLRGDIYRYFPSIDHAILKQDLRRRIACERTLWLCDTIIDGSNPQEPVDAWFPGDDLLTPLARRRGLPLGNLTSQFFANVYLDGFDHWVKEVLRAPYVRYVDDFALFAASTATLIEWQARISQYLTGRRLKLHPDKTEILLTGESASFLGFVLLPGGRRKLIPQNVQRFRRRLAHCRMAWRSGEMDDHEIRLRVGCWIAHARQADTVRLRHHLFNGGWFDPLWSDPSSVKI